MSRDHFGEPLSNESHVIRCERNVVHVDVTQFGYIPVGAHQPLGMRTGRQEQMSEFVGEDERQQI